MGQAIASLRETLTARNEAAREDKIELLTLLVTSANAKLDMYQTDLETLFIKTKQGGAPGIRALRWERGYRVGVSKEATKGVSEVVDGFFGEKDKDGKPNDPNVLNGFKKVISTALADILGNADDGEQEDRKMFVYMQHDAVIRIDVKMWRYSFHGKAVLAQSENILAYILCTSVARPDDLEVDELMFLLNEHAGDDDVEAYRTKLLTLWGRIKSMKN